jgi:hypothetical protein
MGRPLNKKFFGDGANLIACTARIGGGNELCFITSQRSNTQYAVDSEAGPSTRSGFARLVEGAPAGEEEMQVTVTPENAQTPFEATFTFDTAGAAVTAIDIVDGGYGYWAGGTFNITTASGQAGNDAAEITYTVSNGIIVTAVVTVPGATYNNQSGASVNTADIPDEAANPPVQSARIINARQVKTFEGNTYDWPITSPLGTPAVGGLTQADLQTQ